MRLEKVVLDGFKSFADKTEFAFNTPITAIVGPNGCGKSNIVDAVKWVLGEQSVKSLRSDQMADVIFNGSSNRKPLGSAGVSLFISNYNGNPSASLRAGGSRHAPASDDARRGSGQLAIDADEVQITRRIYKSGESEYRINNKVCRLKDIRELFMDTGVGTRAYSILEQGQIERLVSASKAERRFIFEEAAGISKYKAHKKEALRKLERTEQNLLRLADILGEIAKRLRSVKLQAGKAKNYLQYTQRLKELQVKYYLSEFDKINTQLKEKKTSLEQVEQQLEHLTTELTRNETLDSELGERIIEMESGLSIAGNRLISVQSKIEQNLQRIEFLRERIAEIRQRSANTSQRVSKLQEQEKLFNEDVSRYENELENCVRSLDEKGQEAEQIQKTLKQIKAESVSLEASLEDEKSGIIDVVRITAQLHNEIQSISVYRDNLSSQKERLSRRAETAESELEALLTEKAQHKSRLEDIEKVLGQLQQSLEDKRKETEVIDGELEADNKRLAQSKELRSALNSELAILTDMEKRYEGLNNAVKSILRERAAGNSELDYVEGILADIIAADVEYANAVEAALEGKTDSLVINSRSRLLADKQTAEKLDGRVDFICLDKIRPFADRKDFSNFPGVKGRVAEFVRTEDKYAPLAWQLLGKTLIVESLETAAELAGKIGNEYRFVTLEGEFLDADGMIKLGPIGKTTGLISRKSQLHQLQKSVAKVQSEISALEKQIETKTAVSTHLSELCKDLRTSIYEGNTQKMQVSSKLAIYEQDIKRLSQEQPLLAGEIDALGEQIAQSVQKGYDSEQKLQELEAVNDQRTSRIKELESKYAERKEQQQTLQNKLSDLRVSLGQMTEHRQSVEKAILSLQNQMRENQTARRASQEEIRSCSEQLEQTQSDILGCEAAVSGLYVEKEKNQQNSQSLQKEVEQLLEEQKQTEQVIRLKRAEKSRTEATIGELKIELGQFEVKLQDLVERVQEELQIDLHQAYENYKDEAVDWARVRDEIAELRGKIERLGNVNLDAIDEQDGLEKRHEFLSSQVQDLNKSKGQLQQLISRLNKKSREKFRGTFEEIRAHFQQIFRKLFGGGRADIVLEDTEDILEAGIEVIARPPGKETRSISLLSGGEKSMTAIALLFAVFKIKPSPFCFLDEVDAALDEANNERFNMLVREFQKESQFIIITHAKRTMSIADVLFGITMQRRGVSKKISVRFDEYEEESAAVA